MSSTDLVRGQPG